MKEQILIPTVATSEDDVKTSWTLAKLLEKKYEPGLMLVLRRGRKGIIGHAATSQKENLLLLKKEYLDKPIVVMLSNIPIEEIDFFHNTAVALQFVKDGIDFTAWLPIGKRRIMSFHLNALLPPDEFRNISKEKAAKIFETQIAPALEEAVAYGKLKSVELKVETVPEPEFGDVSMDDKRTYLGAKLRQLRNPYPISAAAPICGFERLRKIGLGICMDLSHSRTLGVDLLKEAAMLERTDIVHLNDGSGKYSEEGDVFHEGIALGEGEIGELPAVIKLLREKNIPCILEINETDFEHRPNTRRSIDYLLKV